MALKDDLDSAQATIGAQKTKIAILQDKIRDQEEELRHYRTALAAVRWLWEKAGEQKPFQL